ncbi:hypothetical protein [Methanobrevibacter sp. V74]|uniref:hypothetical protein n=1 Tax=Methanobrevibacter sp. V74 TaxID=3064279 RepID=UPI00273610DE|nr:hypothetical protein [Methanobrevibacter sp. V74]
MILFDYTTKKDTPARLGKVEESNTSFFNLLLEWAMNHPNITFLVLFIVLAALFGLLFNVMHGMFTIESGVMRNFLYGGV